MYKILVVCTANICRSPAAEVLLSEALDKKKISVESAGILALNGHEADPQMRNLMVMRGYPRITEHRSRAVMPSYLTKYHLILCMEHLHLKWLRNASPVSVGKSMLLGHWNSGVEVDDPIGMSPEAYIASIDLMHNCCQEWAKKITTMGLVA